ncbi:MAG: hypothetical protein ABW186_13900 [Rhodanobacteraceae bacterium]
MQSFLAELKRRNVLRVAGVYLVAAWLVTQVAGTVLPMFDAPPWAARSIVLLALGYAEGSTRRGTRRTRRSNGSTARSRRTMAAFRRS